MKQSQSWRIPLFSLSFDEEEKQALTRALDSGWISMGPQTRKFEDSWSNMYSYPSLAVSSGTAAISLALQALDIRPGQEVILPSLTFVADANCIIQQGARPVFADICSNTYPVISPREVEQKISPQTAAILVVHYAGYPAPVDEITKIAEKHNIPVIEDCAHSPFVKYKQQFLGTFGEFGCFSFFANKNITTAEGGMLISKSLGKHNLCKLLRSHGMSTLSWDKHKGHSFQYDVTQPGFNYRIDDIRSTLGLVQLKKLSHLNQRRKEVTNNYWNLLASLQQITLPFYSMNLPSSHYIFPVVFSSNLQRSKIASLLTKEGIQTSLHYPPIHLFTAYTSFKADVPHTETYAECCLTLPLFPSIKQHEIELICGIIRTGLEKEQFRLNQ